MLDGRQFGDLRNEVLNLVMTGIEGKANMARMLDALRNDPPREIGWLPVVSLEDLRDENGHMGPIKGATDFAARIFLVFRLGGGDDFAAKVTLRPSGTETKAKAYLEVGSGPKKAGSSAADWAASCAAIVARARQIATDFLAKVLATHAKDGPAIETVYLQALGRPPAVREREKCLAYIARVDRRAEAFEDILWALINSAEFQTRR